MLKYAWAYKKYLQFSDEVTDLFPGGFVGGNLFAAKFQNWLNFFGFQLALRTEKGYFNQSSRLPKIEACASTTTVSQLLKSPQG